MAYWFVLTAVLLSLCMAGAWGLQRATGNSGWVDAVWSFSIGLAGVLVDARVDRLAAGGVAGDQGAAGTTVRYVFSRADGVADDDERGERLCVVGVFWVGVC